MADDDNFDIDIYGDDAAAETGDYQQGEEYSDTKANEPSQLDGAYDYDQNQEPYSEDIDIKLEHPTTHHEIQQQQHDESADRDQQDHYEQTPQEIVQQVSQQQGVKRKEGHDERALEPGASSAIVVSELDWWINDDDIRGWANQCGVEHELTTITFHEHKVNGKSKGQVYLEFNSPQAASAVKHNVEGLELGPGGKKQKHTVEFHSPTSNPFKTLPKDPPARAGGPGVPRGGSSTGAYERTGPPGRGDYNPNYRGRGGRGGGYGRGGYGAPVAAGGGFNAGMGGFGGGMNNMGGFNNNFRGGAGMMGGSGGMRGGGRGGFNNFNRGGMGMMMGGMPAMGGMPMQMSPMGMNIGMNMGVMGGMPGGFNGNPGHFNPAFFQNQQMAGGAGGGGADGYNNPHGAKRPRPE